jgi:hypothetical protein
VKILYVGPDYLGSNGTCWRDAFVALGCDVRTVDCERLLPWPARLPERVLARLGGRPGRRPLARLNGAIVAAVTDFRPQATFFVQGRHVLPETIAAAAAGGPTVVYFNDDMFNPANQTFTFASTVRQADWLLTTKSFNVPELERAGGRRVLYLPNAFDPAVHHPARPSQAEAAGLAGDVAFLGTFRPERADFLARLADALAGAVLNVWGGGWGKMDRPAYWLRRRRWAGLRRRIRGAERWGAAMGAAIQANRIALGLLYRANRDLHTSRSFEIPACGGFMLAERTPEHQAHFAEDREAVYFGSFEECLDKARYYLAHEPERAAIARAGYERCQRSGYRYVDRARVLLERLGAGSP